MWFFLAFAAVCFTIIVLFRMFIDMRRMEQQHNRLMRADQRDYERYIEVRSRENPQPALPDFKKAMETRKEIAHRTASIRGYGSGYGVGYYQDDPTYISNRQLSEVQVAYLQREMEKYVHEERMRNYMNRNW